jgi:hypothetical protein
MVKRFRWTRKTYRHADHLNRLLARYMDLPDHPPAIVRRYWELWQRHPQREDPLRFHIPPHVRLAARRDDDIPF